MNNYVVLSTGKESAVLFFPENNFAKNLTKFKEEKSHLTATAITSFTHNGVFGFMVNFELTAEGRENRDMWKMLTA